MSNPQPRSRRQWEYLFRERRNEGYDLAYPFVTDQASRAPAVLRDPYTADAWVALSEDERMIHMKRWIKGEVLDGMPDRPAPMPDPHPSQWIPRWVY